MRKCPSCGFNNPQSRDRCVKCSTSLVTMAVPDGSHLADAPTPRFQGMIALRRLWFALGRRLQGDLPDGLSRRWPWTAAYLALLFGMGQVYNHQFVKGAILGVVQVGWIVACVYTWYDYSNNWVLLGMVAWLLYAMADGFTCAVRINGDRWNFRQLVMVWTALLFFWSMVVVFGSLFGRGMFQLVTIQTNSLAPAVREGDKLFVLMRPLSSSRIGRGSVVFYDPPRFAYIRPGGLTTDVYTLNETNSIGVITGIGGDTISWEEGGEILLNGAPVPANLLPVNPNGTPGGMSVGISQNEYGILFTHRVSESGLLSWLGGSWGSTVPNPRQALRNGFGVQEYENVVRVPDSEVDGLVLFRYYPPPRREWFGSTGGLWSSKPADYPERR